MVQQLAKKSTRLIGAFPTDLISSVTNECVLTAKEYLLAVGLYSVSEMK